MEQRLEAGAAGESVPFYRKKIVQMLFGLAATAIFAAGIMSYLKSRGTLYTDNAVVDGQKISVSSQCAGRLMRLTATEGLMVKKGDLLVELDASEANAEMAKAEAALQSGESNVKLCEIGLEKAGQDLKRSRALYASGAVAQAQLEQSEKDFNNMKVQTKLAAIQVRSARAELGIAQAQMRFRRIYSPEDGTVAKRWASEGDVVQPGQVIYTIYDLGRVSVLANMEETVIQGVRVGQEAAVTVDAYPGRPFKGRVASIFPCTASQLAPVQATSVTGDFTKLTQYVSLRVLLDGISSNGLSSRFPVLPGMSAEVRVKGD